MHKTDTIGQIAVDQMHTSTASSSTSAASSAASAVLQRDSDGLLLGRLIGFDGPQPIVAFTLHGICYQATAFVSLAALSAEDLGTHVCMALAEGDLSRLILLGKIRNAQPADCPTENLPGTLTDNLSGKLEITHPHEIALRCGKSTIQLKSDGTIAIRGTNVASRATQTNRIRGGNVQIN